jgi:hypothetical protein
VEELLKESRRLRTLMTRMASHADHLAEDLLNVSRQLREEAAHPPVKDGDDDGDGTAAGEPGT